MLFWCIFSEEHIGRFQSKVSGWMQMKPGSRWAEVISRFQWSCTHLEHLILENERNLNFSKSICLIFHTFGTPHLGNWLKMKETQTFWKKIVERNCQPWLVPHKNIGDDLAELWDMGRQFGRILWDNLSQSGEFMRQFDRVLGFWDTIWKSLGQFSSGFGDRKIVLKLLFF